MSTRLRPVVVRSPRVQAQASNSRLIVNGAPVVESLDSSPLKIGEKVAFTVTASDPEGDKLTYKALNNP